MEFDIFHSNCDMWTIGSNRRSHSPFQQIDTIEQQQHQPHPHRQFDNNNCWIIETTEDESCVLQQQQSSSRTSKTSSPSSPSSATAAWHHNNAKADVKIQISAGHIRSALREKNVSKTRCSVRAVKNKLPQIVEKRNARERRRVQAVNSAFSRLRKAVPIENTRGKRISKVKTLQKAIEYINTLQNLLKSDGGYYETVHFQTCCLTSSDYFYTNATQFEN